MEKKIKVMLADNSESFGVPCSSVMHMYGIETQMVEKDGQRVWTRFQNPSGVVIMVSLCACRCDWRD